MYKIITIPFDPASEGFDEELLNRFVLKNKVSHYYPEFFVDSSKPYWTVFLEYDPVLEKAPSDLMSGLTQQQKLLFDHLRAWRKERADKDGVPVYIVATNQEFIDIVRLVPKSLEALKVVKGFAKGKIATGTTTSVSALPVHPWPDSTRLRMG